MRFWRFRRVFQQILRRTLEIGKRDEWVDASVKSRVNTRLETVEGIESAPIGKSNVDPGEICMLIEISRERVADQRRDYERVVDSRYFCTEHLIQFKCNFDLVFC